MNNIVERDPEKGEIINPAPIKAEGNSYVTPHNIKNYDQLGKIVWAKTWDILTKAEKKIAIDVAKQLLDKHTLWIDQIRYFVSEKMEFIRKKNENF